MQKEFAPEGVTVIAINIAPQANSLQEFRDYMQSYGAGDLVWAQDTEGGRAVRAFQVRGLGTTIIVDREGRIVYEDTGPTPYEVLRDEVRKALG